MNVTKKPIYTIYKSYYRYFFSLQP